MTQYTRLHAAQLLLTALGNPNVSGDAAYWLAGWSAHEIQCGVGCSAPANNLWATEQVIPGSSCWNCPGASVQNYPTLSQGILAMVIVLHNGRYSSLVSALQSNNIAALINSSGVQSDLEVWCGSTCYSRETPSFIADGQAHANDLFNDEIGQQKDWCGLLSGSQQLECIACNLVMPDCGTPPDPTCIANSRLGCQSCVYSCYTHNTSGLSVADCVKQCGVTFSNVGNATPVTPNPASGFTLPGWLTTPDWARVGKFLLGIIVTLFGLGLMYLILAGKIESSQTFKQASQAVATIG